MFRRRGNLRAARMRGNHRIRCLRSKQGLGSPPRAVPLAVPRDRPQEPGRVLGWCSRPSRAAVCRQDLRCPLWVRVGSPLGWISPLETCQLPLWRGRVSKRPMCHRGRGDLPSGAGQGCKAVAHRHHWPLPWSRSTLLLPGLQGLVPRALQLLGGEEATPQGLSGDRNTGSLKTRNPSKNLRPHAPRRSHFIKPC